MKGIVQPSSSKVRTADTLWRGREREWEIKEEGPAPSNSPERGRALFAGCSLLFLCSFSLLYGGCLFISDTGLCFIFVESDYFPSITFGSVSFVFLEESVRFVLERAVRFVLITMVGCFSCRGSFI